MSTHSVCAGLTDCCSYRFQPDKGFSGAEGGGQRDGPVQFQKEVVDEDPFGLNTFLTEAKKAKRPAEDSR